MPQLKNAAQTRPEVQKRIAGQLELMQTLTTWNELINTLPKMLLKMTLLGRRISKVIEDQLAMTLRRARSKASRVASR